MSRPIAPRLRELVKLERELGSYLLPTHSKDAHRQLRALVAVANAAAHQAKHGWAHAQGDTRAPDGTCTCWMCAALATLRIVSSPTRTR